MYGNPNNPLGGGGKSTPPPIPPFLCSPAPRHIQGGGGAIRLCPPPMSVSQVICLTTARPDPIVLRPGVDTVLTVTGQADHEGWYRAATLMLDCQVCGGLPCPRAIAIAIAIV